MSSPSIVLSSVTKIQGPCSLQLYVLLNGIPELLIGLPDRTRSVSPLPLSRNGKEIFLLFPEVSFGRESCSLAPCLFVIMSAMGRGKGGKGLGLGGARRHRRLCGRRVICKRNNNHTTAQTVVNRFPQGRNQAYRQARRFLKDVRHDL